MTREGTDQKFFSFKVIATMLLISHPSNAYEGLLVIYHRRIKYKWKWPLIKFNFCVMLKDYVFIYFLNQVTYVIEDFKIVNVKNVFFF